MQSAISHIKMDDCEFVFRHVSIYASFMYLMGLLAGLMTGWVIAALFAEKRPIKDTPTPKPVPPSMNTMASSTPITKKDPMTSLFDEEESKKVESSPLEPSTQKTFFPTKKGGGYINNAKFVEMNKNYRDKMKMRTKDIESKFSHIVGLSYFRGLGIVEEQGYTLQICSVNGEMHQSPDLSPTCVCVDITDIKYNSLENLPSGKAVIKGIL